MSKLLFCIALLSVASLAQGPEDYASAMRRGDSLKAQNKWSEAEQAYEVAMSRAEGEKPMAAALARAGQMLDKLGHPREAVAYFERSLEFFRFETVEQDLKAVRIRLYDQVQTPGELKKALDDQRALTRGTSPELAKPIELKILFEFDKAVLTPEGRHSVESLGEAITDPNFASESFTIVGHTDLIGTESYNQTLSERRAQAVADEISRRFRIPASRLHAKGMGMSQPLYPTRSEADSRLNRRVEVSIDK
jgi:outer membrane protein OmpA-like peptidoglycan-associated protein